MKRFFIALITVLAAAAVCSVSAFADDTKSSGNAAVSKVYYRLIDHSRVELKWSKVSGADRYYIYKFNKDTGDFIYVTETVKQKYTLKKLDQNTEYTYAVSTVKSSESIDTDIGKNTVTFTTPEKWYYFVDSETFTDESRRYSHRYVYRQHYDGSGREVFDIYKLITEYENFDDYPDSGYAYGVDKIEQKFGYVYIKTTYYDILDASQYDFFRMNNDGTEIISFGGSDYSGCKEYRYSADKTFYSCSTHFDGGMAACLTDSSVWVEFISDDKAKYGMILRKPMSNISNFASDDNYAYFIASPYSDTDRAEESDLENIDKFASVYRVSLDDPTEEQIKNRTELGELIATFDYSFTDDGVTVLGCSNGYLYFMIREEGQSGKLSTYGFYRLGLDGEKNEVEKLCSKEMFRICDIELKDGTIWFFGFTSAENSNNRKLGAYRIDTAAKKPSVKRFFTKTIEGYMSSFEYYTSQNEDHIKITDDYIYIDNRDAYYRVNIAKKTVKTSKTPFIWR
jgi:hypothetical protein